MNAERMVQVGIALSACIAFVVGCGGGSMPTAERQPAPMPTKTADNKTAGNKDYNFNAERQPAPMPTKTVTEVRTSYNSGKNVFLGAGTMYCDDDVLRRLPGNTHLRLREHISTGGLEVYHVPEWATKGDCIMPVTPQMKEWLLDRHPNAKLIRP